MNIFKLATLFSAIMEITLRFYYTTYNSEWFTLFTSGNIKGICCLEEKICHLLEPVGFKCTFINYSVT